MSEQERDGFLGVALERGHDATVQLAAPVNLPSITYVEELQSGRTFAVSPEIETVLGYAQEEWMGDAGLWIERIHPEDRDRVVTACEHANEMGIAYRELYRMIARDGHIVWIRDTAELVRDSEGRPLCWQGVMQVVVPPVE
jgi:two-component system sensor histidine kinase UhpB